MKTVLITGGATGIGKAAAELFAKKGYLTLINYNNSEKAAKELCQKLNSNNMSADCFKADIKSGIQVQNMFDLIYKKYNKIDVLINNAGISLIKEFTQTSESEWDEIFDVNLKGAFLCSKEALKSMIKANKGKIINVSSMWGQTGSSFEVAYSSSKAGLIGFTKALAKEVSPSGINVNAVALGFFETAMNKNVPQEIKQKIKIDTPVQRLGYTDDAASAIYFLASEESDFITGEILNVNGGFII
jgi:3-oxoacyl-[acyl-carrier protein] reductase